MIRSIVTAAVLFSLAGCGAEIGKPLPKTEQVTGTVTLDDKPLEGALVTFIPAGGTKGIECVGQTDEGGEYAPRQIRGGEGVPAGDYKVVISRPLQGGQPVRAGELKDSAGGAMAESLPVKYSSVTSTTLTAKVDEGGSQIDFKLKSK